MLTIKRIDFQERETIVTAEHVQYFPQNVKQSSHEPDFPILRLYGVPRTFCGDTRAPDSDEAEFHQGICYVVNEYGKTVGHYSLPGTENSGRVAGGR